MSSLFIRAITGTGIYAVPDTDAELTTATNGIATIVSGVAGLSYARLLGWVESNSDTPATRTFSANIDAFTYNGDENPDAAEVAALTTAIEVALEADPDISSVQVIEVNSWLNDLYWLWQLTGNALHPRTTSHDVVVGGSSIVDGEIFRVAGKTRIEGLVNIGSSTTWITEDGSNNLSFTDSVSGTKTLAQLVAGQVTYKSYGFTSRGIGAGTHYVGGFYSALPAAAFLTQASPSITYGTANIAYGAHAFIVAGGAGTVVGGGTVALRISGTSITDAGVRTILDTETIVADITTLSTDDYVESPKKWLGTITFELIVTGGSPSSYSLNCNYGLCKYDDFGNRNYTLTDIEVVGEGGGNDSSFEIVLLHHRVTGWTYDVAAFEPGSLPPISSMEDDYSTEDDIANNTPFAYKRAGLSESINGVGDEGHIIKIVMGATNSVQFMNAHIGVQF